MSERQSDAAFLEAESEVFASYSLTPRTRHLRLPKPALALRAIEVGSGEPALFLHGMGGAAVHWASLLSRLPSLRKIALDMPGHGASDDVDYRGLDLRSWYKDLLTGCLDQLGLESAHIVGHSMSAMFGMWLAIDAPERVRSLIALGTPAAAFGEGRPPVFIRLVAQPGIGRAMLSMPAPLVMYRRMMATMLGRHAVDNSPEHSSAPATSGHEYAPTRRVFPPLRLRCTAASEKSRSAMPSVTTNWPGSTNRCSSFGGRERMAWSCPSPRAGKRRPSYALPASKCWRAGICPGSTTRKHVRTSCRPSFRQRPQTLPQQSLGARSCDSLNPWRQLSVITPYPRRRPRHRRARRR